jgi:hypothetical protein
MARLRTLNWLVGWLVGWLIGRLNRLDEATAVPILEESTIPITHQTKQIIVEDVSNPGKHDEVVPTIGDSGHDYELEQDEEERKGNYEEEPFHRQRRQMREVCSVLVVACGLDRFELIRIG